MTGVPEVLTGAEGAVQIYRLTALAITRLLADSELIQSDSACQLLETLHNLHHAAARLAFYIATMAREQPDLYAKFVVAMKREGTNE